MTNKTTGFRKHVFGPIPSRLFGRTLGVDPFVRKVCNFDCVYCHLGRPKPSVTRSPAFAPSSEVTREVKAALAAERNSCDWITISGSGEPTLHPKLGAIVRGIQKRTTIPVAVFTNGSMLGQPSVQRALATANAVVVTIDAGDATEFRFVNRAHRSVSFEEHVAGIVQFREHFEGRLYTQVMLVPGVNDSIESLMKIRGLLERIRPTEAFVTNASRPPLESWVGVPDRMTIERARTILGVEYRRSYAAPAALKSTDPLSDRIRGILARHPMTAAELRWWFQDVYGGDVDQALAELKREQLASRSERAGEVYWMKREAPPNLRVPKPRPQRPRLAIFE